MLFLWRLVKEFFDKDNPVTRCKYYASTSNDLVLTNVRKDAREELLFMLGECFELIGQYRREITQFFP